MSLAHVGTQVVDGFDDRVLGVAYLRGISGTDCGSNETSVPGIANGLKRVRSQKQRDDHQDTQCANNQSENKNERICLTNCFEPAQVNETDKDKLTQQSSMNIWELSNSGNPPILWVSHKIF